MTIQTDASRTGWGAVCLGETAKGIWSSQEQNWHINILELLAVKLPLLTFTKDKAVKSIHFQIDNTTALRYLLKIGGTKNLKLIELSKEIWEYLLLKGITITAEYLPNAMNTEAGKGLLRVEIKPSNISKDLQNT